MTDLESRAQRLIDEFAPFCDEAGIIHLTPRHWQLRVKRKVESAPSALFSDDTTCSYPFDGWCVNQTVIYWTSGGKGKFWIGNLSDGTRVTIKVEA